jgi:8-oxo-dGTP diphosphatase
MEKREVVMEYVLGFAFTEDFESVALIRKNKPEWQSGKLNGIGGKVEEYDESIFHAIVREYHEETGVITNIDHWKYFTKLYGNDFARQSDNFAVHCFYIVNDAAVRLVRTTTDEVVSVYNTTHFIYQNVIDNLRWQIPMAIEFANNLNYKIYSEVKYTGNDEQ